jgi:hypothetical protein
MLAYAVHPAVSETYTPVTASNTATSKRVPRLALHYFRKPRPWLVGMSFHRTSKRMVPEETSMWQLVSMRGHRNVVSEQGAPGTMG